MEVIKMLNVGKLRGAMAEAQITQRDIAVALGKSENTITDRFKGRKAFDVNEAEKICKLIGITDNGKKAEIFLANSSHIKDDNFENL